MSFVKKAASTEEIAPLFKQIYDEDPTYWPHGLSMNNLSKDAGDEVYVIRKEAAGKPVGFVGWQVRTDNSNKKVGYYMIGILPEHRNKGYAKEAVAKVIKSKAGSVDKVMSAIVDGNTNSAKLANSLGVQIKQLDKSAAVKPWVWDLLAGAGAAAGMDYAMNNKDYSNTDHLPARIGLGITNVAGGALARRSLASGKFDAGMHIIGGMAVKDLALTTAIGAPNFFTDFHNASESLKELSKKETTGGGSSTGDGDSSSGSWKDYILPSVLGAGAVGLGAYGIYKGLKSIADKEQVAPTIVNQGGGGGGDGVGGRIRITLPTKNPGDQETTVEMPIEQMEFSNAMMDRIRRDVRRRMMAESKARTVRRGESVASKMGLPEVAAEEAAAEAEKNGFPPPPVVDPYAQPISDNPWAKAASWFDKVKKSPAGVKGTPATSPLQTIGKGIPPAAAGQPAIIPEEPEDNTAELEEQNRQAMEKARQQSWQKEVAYQKQIQNAWQQQQQMRVQQQKSWEQSIKEQKSKESAYEKQMQHLRQENAKLQQAQYQHETQAVKQTQERHRQEMEKTRKQLEQLQQENQQLKTQTGSFNAAQSQMQAQFDAKRKMDMELQKEKMKAYQDAQRERQNMQIEMQRERQKAEDEMRRSQEKWRMEQQKQREALQAEQMKQREAMRQAPSGRYDNLYSSMGLQKSSADRLAFNAMLKKMAADEDDVAPSTKSTTIAGNPIQPTKEPAPVQLAPPPTTASGISGINRSQGRLLDTHGNALPKWNPSVAGELRLDNKVWKSPDDDSMLGTILDKDNGMTKSVVSFLEQYVPGLSQWIYPTHKRHYKALTQDSFRNLRNGFPGGMPRRATSPDLMSIIQGVIGKFTGAGAQQQPQMAANSNVMAQMAQQQAQARIPGF